METVKLIRQTLRIKQYEFAKLLGSQQTNYSKIENGVLIPKIREKAFEILKPELKIAIEEIEERLEFLKQLYEDI